MTFLSPQLASAPDGCPWRAEDEICSWTLLSQRRSLAYFSFKVSPKSQHNPLTLFFFIYFLKIRCIFISNLETGSWILIILNLEVKLGKPDAMLSLSDLWTWSVSPFIFEIPFGPRTDFKTHILDTLKVLLWGFWGALVQEITPSNFYFEMAC